MTGAKLTHAFGLALAGSGNKVEETNASINCSINQKVEDSLEFLT